MQKLQANPFAQIFGPQMWVKLQTNPSTAPLLNDPSFVQKMKQLQANPNLIQQYMGDPQVSQAIGVILGIPINPGAATAAADAGNVDNTTKNPYDTAQSSTTTSTKPKKEEEKPKPKETDEEREYRLEKEKIEAERKAIVAEADVFKNKGNESYKAKDFTQALEFYDKAIDTYGDNPTYYTNKASVYMAQKDYNKAVEVCEEAVKGFVGKRVMAPYKIMAKSYLRMGNAYMKLKDYEKAITAYTDSNFEDRTDASDRALKKAKVLYKKQQDEAYLDDELSVKAKNAGNELFKQGKFKEAIEQYTEAIKRNPKNIAAYSNRANCYSKLMSWQQALNDSEKCIEIDPTFIKAHIRKGKTLHFLRSYHKAISAFDDGLKIDPNNRDLLQAKRETETKVAMENMEGKVDPQRRAQAMQDPEIQAILQDPQMMNILQNMQNDPSGAQRAMQDPTIRAKVNKLVQAGVLQVR